jgi:flagellar L-ring protein precursor FlgH
MKRIICLLCLSGCLKERLSTLDEPPVVTQIQNPNETHSPVSMPMPDPVPFSKRAPNSLWENGSRAFFKDQRARRVGDILTVIVDINQEESMQAKPQLSRQSTNSTSVNHLLGWERKMEALFPKKQRTKAQIAADKANPNWFDTNSNTALTGDSKYDLTDVIKFKIAAYIVQVLPNGNLVIHGRQEIRLVNEVREIQLRGIVRREDVDTNNKVKAEKIAELRISYGGRGELTDLQDFPWGQKILNKITPF